MATWEEGVFSRYRGVLRRAREGGTARLAAERLDLLRTTVLAISDQRVELSIGVAEVPTLPVGTGVALRVDAFGGSPPTFDFTPGTHRRRFST